MLVSVVIPVKNEQGSISRLIEEIHATLETVCSFEIVITDDGSEDNTIGEAIAAATRCDARLQILHHPVNCGQSTALHTAICHAKGDLIATLDGDGQNDPNDIPAMIREAQAQKAEHFCIAGYRNKRKDTAWVRLQSKIANRVRKAFLKDGVPDTGCGLKVFPRETFLLLPYFDHMHRFLPALIRRMHGEIVVHPVAHRDRFAGTSKYTVWNRLWVGIIDLFGVAWLIRRSKWPIIEKRYPPHD